MGKTKPESMQKNASCSSAGKWFPDKTAGQGLLGRSQDLLKKYGRLYYFLVWALGPVMTSRRFRKALLHVLRNHGEESIIINIGSGPTYLEGRRDIINLDLFAFDEVDVVADASNLPMNDESVDLVINIAMLEHAKAPEEIVEEMHRVLRRGGEAICYVPFMVPFHAAPHDFHRWTLSGAEWLFSGFDEVEAGIGAGPTSGMLWILQEWLALLLSFGNSYLHDLLFMVLMVIMAPLKLFDLLLVRFPHAEKIASGFYIRARK